MKGPKLSKAGARGVGVIADLWKLERMIAAMQDDWDPRKAEALVKRIVRRLGKVYPAHVILPLGAFYALYVVSPFTKEIPTAALVRVVLRDGETPFSFVETTERVLSLDTGMDFFKLTGENPSN